MAHFNHFDFIAPTYDRLIKPGDPSKLAQMVGLPVMGKLLDVGGGTGRISYSLREMVKSTIDLDSSMGMLNQASKKAGLILVCSESEHLPIKDSSIDRLIMVDALHHVADYRITLKEMWRVLRPGGRMIIEEPDIRTAGAKMMAIFEKLLLMRSHFISPQKIAEAIQSDQAQIKIESEGMTTWVLIDKLVN